MLTFLSNKKFIIKITVNFFMPILCRFYFIQVIDEWWLYDVLQTVTEPTKTFQTYFRKIFFTKVSRIY